MRLGATARRPKRSPTARSRMSIHLDRPGDQHRSHPIRPTLTASTALNGLNATDFVMAAFFANAASSFKNSTSRTYSTGLTELASFSSDNNGEYEGTIGAGASTPPATTRRPSPSTARATAAPAAPSAARRSPSPNSPPPDPLRGPARRAPRTRHAHDAPPAPNRSACSRSVGDVPAFRLHPACPRPIGSPPFGRLMNQQPRHHGFTLIELLVVVAIIVALLGDPDRPR